MTPQSLLDAARARATAPNFTRVFDDPVTGEGPLSGLTVAVKDLFDVRGYQTTAGTTVRADLSMATEDAAVVARLRKAGAGLIGHANMTELAYSGLGLNPHYGTPLTPLREGCIAGGSARIPAAFCRLYGFKATAASIPRTGAAALSHSLDSIGVMTRDVGMLRPTLNVLRDSPCRMRRCCDSSQ